MRLAHRILRRLGFVARRQWWLSRCPGLELGSGVRLGRGFRCYIGPQGHARIGDHVEFDIGATLEVRGQLSVGNDTFFGHRCTIAVSQRVHIGAGCMVGEMVSIRDHDHEFRGPLPLRHQGMRLSDVLVGDNVWIGSKVTVVRGATVGDRAVIGANAVVTGDIPAHSVAVGLPARVTSAHPVDGAG